MLKLSIFVHRRRAIVFLFGVLFVVAAQACKLSISFLYLVLHFRDWLQTNRFLQFCDWNDKFMLFCFFLHEL